MEQPGPTPNPRRPLGILEPSKRSSGSPRFNFVGGYFVSLFNRQPNGIREVRRDSTTEVVLRTRPRWRYG